MSSGSADCLPGVAIDSATTQFLIDLNSGDGVVGAVQNGNKLGTGKLVRVDNAHEGVVAPTGCRIDRVGGAVKVYFARPQDGFELSGEGLARLDQDTLRELAAAVRDAKVLHSSDRHADGEIDLLAHWDQAGEDERRRFASEIGNLEREWLLEEFQRNCEEGYRALVFGTARSKPTIEGVNDFMDRVSGKKLDDDQRVEIVNAIQFFRNELAARLVFDSDKRTIPCSLTTSNSKANGRRFFVRSLGQNVTVLAHRSRFPTELTLSK